MPVLWAATMGDFYGAPSDGVNDRKDGGAKLCVDCGVIVDSWEGERCRRCAQEWIERQKVDRDLERKLRNHRLHKAHWAGGVIGAYMRELCSLEVIRAERQIRAEEDDDA